MKTCSVAFEDVASVENLCAAWEEFIRGKRKKEDVLTFMRNLADEIASLHEDLLSGAYRHGSYIHFRICDPKVRDIHKACVRDRLLHHAIHRQLYPFYDRMFISDSFSCRIDKGIHRALDRFQNMERRVSKNHTRTCWALKCDIKRFFASINHDVLLKIIAERIRDQRLLGLIARIVESFEVDRGRGIPLGNLTSQLFANIYMNELDRFVKRFLRAEQYIRYADDFVMLSVDRDQLISFLPIIQPFLRDRLHLTLHPNKIFLQTIASGVDFLGWVHFPYHRVPRTATKRRMLSQIRQCPEEATLQSYLGMLSHGDARELSERVMNEGWLWRSCGATRRLLDESPDPSYAHAT